MTHSNLLRVFSYLGFRAKRKHPGSTSIIVFPALIPVVLPQRRTQSVDDRSTLWQPYRCTKGDSRSRLSIVAMGQASSLGGADENTDRSKGGTAPANPSNDVNEGVVSADAEKAVVVSPEQTLPSKPAATEDVKKEVETKADELGDPPERPLAGDCCGQGCDVCVWDTYNDELRDYLARKKALLAKAKSK